MGNSAKYIIHADIHTNGVVERSDVVGAIFGQTEGLLGEELDLRDLQNSSKVGRIDVSIESEGGRSFGTITIASGLDKVETSVLAAALETIQRVGPSRAECTVTSIEDARAAKRREIVDRATQLLAEFEEQTLTSNQLVEEVRQRSRVENITDYYGLPAGPRVPESDAIIVVEGRADVRQLLEYGIRNAIAVEGTNIPDAVARLTTERTTTAFLDGDRGGDLILRELDQVGDVDYVAFAPSGKSVEELDRAEIMSALRKKLPYEQVADGDSPRETFSPTDGGTVEPIKNDGETPTKHSETGSESPESDSSSSTTEGPATEASTTEEPATEASTTEESSVESTGDSPESESKIEESDSKTLGGHVQEVISTATGRVRLLDDSLETLNEVEVAEAFDAIADAEEPPETVILDGTLSQRVLDVAAQRGVGQIVAADTGEFVKQPTSVRIRTADELEAGI